MDKIYTILLSGSKIGETRFERGDPPMGVVTGIIKPSINEFGYKFIKDYCIQNQIKINTDDIEYECIDTQIMPKLIVYNDSNIELKGQGNYISGMTIEGFEINSLGIPFPFYEKEFPAHVEKYYGK